MKQCKWKIKKNGAELGFEPRTSYILGDPKQELDMVIIPYVCP